MQHGARRRSLLLCLAMVWLAGAAIPGNGATASSPSTSKHPGDWLQQGHDPRKTAFNPSETTISSSNVSQLVPDWRAASPPSLGLEHDAVVANGFVYVGHDYGMSVYSLECGTGGIECDPVWTTNEGAIRGPVVVGDLVFTSGGNPIQAYSALGCGLSVCEPVMSLDCCGDGAWTITGAGDVVVVTAQTYSWAQVGLYVFDLSQCSGDPCQPAWTAKIGPHEAGSVAVARGSIYVGGDKNMFVFDLAGCGGEICSASWVALTGSVGHADTTPTVADGFVYLLSAAVAPNQRSLSAFPANGCAHPTCKPTWAADVGTVSSGGSLAVAYGKVWVMEYGRLDAFNSGGCGGKPLCEPRWVGVATGLQPYPPPTVASDVVYTVARGTIINPFATTCDSDVCYPLAALSVDVGFANEVFVSNGKLVVSGIDGVEVFGLP